MTKKSLRLPLALLTLVLASAILALPVFATGTSNLQGTATTIQCGQSSMALAGPLTATDGITPVITAAGDIRIQIKSTTNAVWDTSRVTLPAFGGTASSKASNVVSYPDSKTLLIDVTADFTANQNLVISGLYIVGGTCAGVGSTGAKPLQWSVNGSSYGDGYASTDITVTKTISTNLNVNNQPPVFDSGISGPSDNGSSGTTPTNAGANVNFTATASDPNGDQWYLAICKTPYIKPSNNALPVCCSDAGLTTCGDPYKWIMNSPGAQKNSGEEASLFFRTNATDAESNPWYAFACDGNGAGGIGDPDHQCSTYSQGSEETSSRSPFNVNHRPVIGTVTAGNAFGTNASVDPGSGPSSGGSPFEITTQLGTQNQSAQGLATAVQSDGKYVVVGYDSNDNYNSDFAIARYNTDGTLDGTFGTGGIVSTDVTTGKDDKAYAVAIQSDGKIVVAGDTYSTGSNSHYIFAVVRYNTNGTLDGTFGTGGKVTTNLGTTSPYLEAHATSVAIQSDGSIVAAGWSSTTVGTRWPSFTVIRYTTAGVLDSSFGTGGITRTDFGRDQDDKAYSVAIQSDQKIVVAGYTDDSTDTNSFALARYTTNGGLDGTFGTGGLVTTNIQGETSIAYGVAIQGDGKIVAAGSGFATLPNQNFTLVRYNSDGSLDQSFDGSSSMPHYPGNGIVTTAIGTSYSEAHSITIPSSGKIAIAGYAETGGAYTDAMALAQYNTTDGSLDTGFGNGGMVLTPVNVNGSYVYGLAHQTDGKLVAAGWSWSDAWNPQLFALVRYTTAGAIDTTGGGSGTGTVYVRVGVTDPDIDTAADTISMYVCSTDSFVSGACAATTLCSIGGVASGTNADCSFDNGAPIPTASGSYPIFIFLKDSHGFTDDGTNNTHSYNVTDIAPTVSTYSVNDIDPTAGGSFTTSFTVLVEDDNGYADIDTVNGLIYDSSGAGNGGTTLSGGTCTPNEKNCYLRAACTKAQYNSSATQITATCDSITTWFNINPTSPGVWKAHVNAIDSSHTTIGDDSATSITVAPLSAVAIAEPSIPYGGITVGGTSDASEPTTLQNVGNLTIDIGIHGTDMVSGSYAIPLAQQHWATATDFTYGVSDHALVASPETVPGNADQGCSNESVAVRAAHDSGSTDSHLYWKLRIPALQPSGSYAGTNTFTSIVDGQCTGSD